MLSDAEKDRIRALRREGVSTYRIAEAMGLARHQVRKVAERTAGNTKYINSCGNSYDHYERPPVVTEAEIADRNRRLELSPRDLSAAFFGDPLPGYSALDRR